MFSKALFLAALCSAAVLTNAAPDLTQERIEEITLQISADIEITLQQLDSKVKNLLDKVRSTWRTFWDRVTGRENARNQQEIEELKNELLNLQRDSGKQLAKEKAKWQALLNNQEAELNQLRDDKEALARARQRLADLQHQAADAINGVVNDWDKKVDNLGAKIQVSVRG